jgi:copper transport protein
MSRHRSPRRSRHWFRRGGGVALLTTFIGLAGATPASAHPYLLRSDPAAGSILTAAPHRIDISYTEGLDRSYCTVTLVSPSGQQIQTHQVAASQPSELSVAADQPLDQGGTYAVDWSAVGDDGHTVIGSFGFSIGHPSANPAVTNSAGSNTGSAAAAGGVQRLLRTILPFATSVLAGLLLLAAVLTGAGRPVRRLRAGALAVQAATVAGLGVALALDGGLAAFGSSDTGRRLIADIALTLLAIPALRDGRVRRAVGYVAALGLLVVLALSGHASTQPMSRRALVVSVYSVHLASVAVWLGALLSVALLPERRRSLRLLVIGSLFAVLVTGVATTDWGLRTLHDLPGTLYGRLSLSLLGLFLLIVGVGATASWLQLRRGNRRAVSWLVGVEAVVATAALIVAGALGQVAQPLDQPYASQAFAADSGMPVSVSSAGPDSLAVASLAPGVVGRNTLVIEVGQSDEQDFLSPASGVRSVEATLSCGCGESDQRVTLHPTGHGSAWTASVDLSRPASWLVATAVHRAGEPVQTVDLTSEVTPPSLPHQVVIGVPAALSGPDGATCRDQVLGLQTALTDLNSSAADRGNLMRVVTVDLHAGVAVAMSRLRELGARMIALPCGTSRQVGALTAAARSGGLPVVLGADNGDSTTGGVWSTQPSWQAEGTAIATQALQQQANAVTAVSGPTAVDRAELDGLRAGLVPSKIPLRVVPFPRSPKRLVTSLARHHADLLAVLGDPTEASPLVRAFSAANQLTGWSPSRGILASSQLMSTDFINDAGLITRVGGIEFASDVNPFDPVSQYYAQRLRALSPGVRPTFTGLHGYEAGVAIAQALDAGGGDPTPGRLTSLLGERFHDFALGSYRLGWQPSGGTSTSLAFFRSTYVNPMAMPANAPGGASSLAHEGTFLDSGGFEQVAPFRRLK